MFDGQMRQRTPDLGRLAAGHLAASFGRVEVMTAAIGIKAQRQAVPPAGDNDEGERMGAWSVAAVSFNLAGRRVAGRTRSET
jgi:hypothetical protein